MIPTKQAAAVEILARVLPQYLRTHVVQVRIDHARARFDRSLFSCISLVADTKMGMVEWHP